MDDLTIGEMLTEVYRGQVDYFVQEGVSVSQSSSSSVRSDGSGQPDGERNVDQSVSFGVTRNTYSAHSKFSENTRTEKMVDRSGQPDECHSSKAQIRTPLGAKTVDCRGISLKSQSSRTPSSSRRRRASTLTTTIMATESGIS